MAYSLASTSASASPAASASNHKKQSRRIVSLAKLNPRMFGLACTKKKGSKKTHKHKGSKKTHKRHGPKKGTKRRSTASAKGSHRQTAKKRRFKARVKCEVCSKRVSYKKVFGWDGGKHGEPCCDQVPMCRDCYTTHAACRICGEVVHSASKGWWCSSCNQHCHHECEPVHVQVDEGQLCRTCTQEEEEELNRDCEVRCNKTCVGCRDRLTYCCDECPRTNCLGEGECRCCPHYPPDRRCEACRQEAPALLHDTPPPGASDDDYTSDGEYMPVSEEGSETADSDDGVAGDAKDEGAVGDEDVAGGIEDEHDELETQPCDDVNDVV